MNTTATTVNDITSKLHTTAIFTTVIEITLLFILTLSSRNQTIEVSTESVQKLLHRTRPCRV